MLIASDSASRCPLPMPFGWFQVLYSQELAVGESKPLHYFDQELVAFRTESGIARVVDAYCPHMGAHLGYGIRDQAGGGSVVAAGLKGNLLSVHFTAGSTMVRDSAPMFLTLRICHPK